jgi:small subunit ribosomal protein S2
MPRKKKEEITETIKEETKQEVPIVEIGSSETVEGVKADVSEAVDEDKPKKKKEVKKLSEKELKRVMTDTKETLVPLTDYIACSVHLGTKVITPDMRKYVYKRRADGLAVINTNLIDDKIRDASAFFNQFAPEDVFIVSKRESSWPAVEKFSEVTGIRAFMKKYPAGIITNLRLDNFFEAKLVIICDPWVDKNALNDSLRLQIPTLAICDTNNYARLITKVIPSNNKSRKSVGLILFILAREYLKSLGKEKEAKELKIEDFAGKIEQVNEDADAAAKRQETDFRKPRDFKDRREGRARYGV